MPSVITSLLDEQKGVRYDVFAFRALSRQELLDAVGVYLSQTKRRRNPKPGTVVKIISIIGHNE